MRMKLLVALGVGALTFAGSQIATAGVSVGLSFGVPAPVYIAPAPAYVAPVPVYAPPPELPVVAYQAVPVVAPAPVYVAPVPVVTPVAYIGWHGDQYWDGYRWWGRRDWDAHRR